MEDIINKIYEVSFLVTKEEDAEVIWKYLAGHKAEVESKSSLTLTTLSYPIKKETKAYFGYARFSVSPSEIAGLNDDLRLEVKVLRHLIIIPSLVKNHVSEPSEKAPKAAKKPVAREMSNEALEAKLADLQGGVK